MKQLPSTIYCDFLIQLRNGFYTATFFVLLFVVLGLSRLPGVDWGWLLPLAILLYMNMTAYYFIAAQVLLEKDEGISVIRAVMPFSPLHYLCSKIVTLGFLAVLESTVLAIVVYGFGFNWFPFIIGIFLASAFYALVGFISVTRYNSLEEYLLPSVLYGALASLPLITGLAQLESPLLFIHPLQAVLVVLQSAFAPVEIGLLAYGVLYSIISLAVLFYVCIRLYQGMVIQDMEG
ncbi:ABC transporter permease [Candidatus Contubernalis alkaliaceticus]|uniref:ABC transporter permease n=1 Tax=Candidatus Contubernalis alkaliaceticus TaxID=338645 RepID=UPI001F4C417A|nr:ABC transporter permease [Candidatus Contubernalis alkalaceticus]UNC93015.1 hypothetical protein HUE98_13485 [Candidatus Contubernalis alkalaceticus]